MGLIFLASGNTRRLRLIYEFTASAAELAAVLARLPERGGSEEENYRRYQISVELSNYKNALLKLGAYEQALQVSRWITLTYESE